MILVLGASSFVGRLIFQSFGPCEVVGTYKNHRVDGCVFFDASSMRLSDILKPNMQITHAVILYAEPKIDACKADLKRSYEINVRSTKVVIDDLVEMKVKPIFTSSEYVFDGEKGDYIEEDHPHPITVYGAQKLEIEQYLMNHCDDFAILRLAKVFGTNPQDGTILSGWMNQIQKGEEIRCAYDQVFSPIHVGDVVKVVNAVVRRNLHGLFHIANVEAVSRLEMLQMFIEVLELEARVVECSIKDFNFLDARPLNLSMIPKKIMEATGLKPRSIRDCCEGFATRLEKERVFEWRNIHEC